MRAKFRKTRCFQQNVVAIDTQQANNGTVCAILIALLRVAC